ncbi:hypothetical protein EDD11_001788 [Mortierella claussenii]|nr:hypothetical protein EDD11_001788 [Mortierella claussenii]
MSATSLSRRVGIRASSGSARAAVKSSTGSSNPAAQGANNTRPRHQSSSSINADAECASTTRYPTSSSSTSTQQQEHNQHRQDVQLQLYFTQEPQEITDQEQVEETNQGKDDGHEDNPEEDEEEVVVEIKTTLGDDMHAYLFNDHFSRAYRPSFHSVPVLSSKLDLSQGESNDGHLTGIRNTATSSRVPRLRPNTVHQDSLIGGRDVYNYYDHGFPIPPRSRSAMPPEAQVQAQQQQQQHLDEPTPTALEPQSPPSALCSLPPQYSPVSRQAHGSISRVLSRSKIPPRRESMWLASTDEIGAVAAHTATHTTIIESRSNDDSGAEFHDLGLADEVDEEVDEGNLFPSGYSEYLCDSQENNEQDIPAAKVSQERMQEHSQRRPHQQHFLQRPLYRQQHQYGEVGAQYPNQSSSSPSRVPLARPQRPETLLLTGNGENIMPAGPIKHFANEMETQETLKRERTRILQRMVVSDFREINYSDITNMQPLKKGGFGEIHTAEWSRLQVVLKRALDEGAEQFDQELEILKRVHDYDFIVPFYGVTTDPYTNVRCMVMKYCSNGNLCSFLEVNHTTLTWVERYRLSIEITKGLEFLHKSGFHHRDLHSGNILLDDKRTAMICDFGLSRSSNKTRTSDLGATVGVASFLAPERFSAKRPIYSTACDIYSLGVIFWHISSGRIPFVNRLRDPLLLRELMEGCREEIVEGTPPEYRDLLIQCWDVNPAKRLKIDVVIAILQTLLAKPSEPIHRVAAGFTVPSNTTSAALPVPPELDTKMADLERASNALNKMVFDIKDPTMKETVIYINCTRAFFREQRTPIEAYSPSNPPKVPIYLCPLVGDIPGFNYHLSIHKSYNPINESSEQAGDTALHLACLFLESPLDTIKVLVELGADINLENLQGYTPIMILATSNTQCCYEALRYLVRRGARIPAYIRNPITPLNNAHIYAQNVVNESRQQHLNEGNSIASVGANGGGRSQNNKADQIYSQNRPLIHVVAAMQDDYRILDCLCEAGLDPAISFGGETALVAAAAHLQIKNMEWLLNNDLDISSEAGIARAAKVVRMLHAPFPTSPADMAGFKVYGQGTLYVNANHKRGGQETCATGSLWSRLDPKEFPEDVRELGKYSWAGVAYRNAGHFSKDMVGPVLELLEQWTGPRRIKTRREVATKLKLDHAVGPMRVDTAVAATTGHSGTGTRLPPVATVAVATVSEAGHVPYIPPPPANRNRIVTLSGGHPPGRQLSLRKNQRPLIDQVLLDRVGFGRIQKV